MTPFISFIENQRGRMQRFGQIERMNGFWRPTQAFDIQEPHAQCLLRRYGWQIVEEVCEVRDAWGGEHMAEEIADVYHFLIELMIAGEFDADLCEILPQNLEDHFELRSIFLSSQRSHWSPANYWLSFIEQIGMTMNLLKNRPWRTDNRPTDRRRFIDSLRQCFVYFYYAADASNQTALSLSLAYSLKAKINEKRYQDQVQSAISGDGRAADSSNS